MVGREEAFLCAEDLGADGKDRDVCADEDEAKRVGEGVDVEGPAADRAGFGQQPERDEEADHECNNAWDEEEPARAVEEQEAEVTPAVAPGAEVGRPGPAVGGE